MTDELIADGMPEGSLEANILFGTSLWHEIATISHYSLTRLTTSQDVAEMSELSAGPSAIKDAGRKGFS